MGGHGGLNILPQKRWNVYGRENRLKVRRDEAQAAAEQAERDALHSKAESEFRHAALLRRAHVRSGAADSTTDALPSKAAPDTDAIEAAEALRPGVGAAAPGAPGGRTAVIPSRVPQPAFDLVSFLQDDRAAAGKLQHPEVTQERRREDRARGDAKTRTSDAKFDAQFAFGHRLAGEANLPWYAKAAAAPSEPPPPQPAAAAAAGALPCSEAAGEEGSRRSRKERRAEARKDRKREHKRGEKRSRKRELPELDDAGAAALKEQLLARLRGEREAREGVERAKAARAVAEATAAVDGGPVGKRYHGAYGNRRQ